MKPVRIWFEKKGAARFISHLDLNRCISRAIHQAKIPLWYTQGFNPHAFLTFALPLPLGVRGERESFDIRLEEDLPEEELLRRLNAVLPEDIRLFSAKPPVKKPGEIAWARYRIELEPENGDCAAFCGGLRALLGSEGVWVEKRTKSGTARIDLHPYFRDTEIREEGGKAVLEPLLPAGSRENINPLLLLQALEQRIPGGFYASVSRQGLFDAEKKEFA